MIKVTDLPRGWALRVEAGMQRPIPWFVHQDGRRRDAWEFAGLPEAPVVYTALKRWLDIADREWKQPGSELRWRGADMAKFALEASLKAIERWEPSLKETEVYV